MNQEILEFYLESSIYTNYEPYEEYYKSLPKNIEELTDLVMSQTIHRVELRKSREEYLTKGKSHDHISEEYPWWKYISHDDILLTAPAITAELFRQDNRGFTKNREVRNKVVITCRYVAVLLASILKAKKIPCRVRSGFASYFRTDGKYIDHWIVEYYDKNKKRWIICDPDPSSGKDDLNKYIHGSSFQGLNMLAYSLFFDFHALMGDEISYLFMPSYIDDDKEFFSLSTNDLKELDDLATLMLNPTENFDALRYIFFTDKKFRILNTPLLSDKEHLEIKINN